MIEITGNIWDYHERGEVICITTNGSLNKQRKAVMGRGVARQAKDRFSDLPKDLAAHIMLNRNTVGWFPAYSIISFPVKHKWWEEASIDLIKKSAQQLRFLASQFHVDRKLYMVRPGCGNGGLKWEDVRLVLGAILIESRYIIVEQASEDSEQSLC